jgi:putative transposase
MARPLRMDYAGGWYHVMNRGIERRDVFLNDDDRRAFVRLVSELEERAVMDAG